MSLSSDSHIELARKSEPAPLASDADTSEFSDQLAKLYDEFAELIRQDDETQIDRFLQQHKRFAPKLRRLVPTIRAMLGLPSGKNETSPTPLEQGDPSFSHHTLGDFRLLREVGRGGMGVVYQAEQLSMNRTVALKVLPFAAVMDERHVQRFKNEVQAAALLQHQNIVPVYSVGCERGVHYFAMQFIVGRSLSELIAEIRESLENNRSSADSKKRRFDASNWASRSARSAVDNPLKDDSLSAFSTSRSSGNRSWFCSAVEVMVQAAEALEHAHARGVLHRDIKPGNMMVDVTQNLWVTDFGLARLEADSNITMTGDVVGTLRYMSPEQARGANAMVDERTDVYSLGATMYELLALKPAFDQQDRSALLRQILEDDPKPLTKHDSSIPKELETVVHKAMEKNAADRYSSAREMGADLKRFLDQRPILAKPPSIVDKVRKWSQRHLGVVWTGMAASVLLVMILGASTLIVWSGQNKLKQQRELAVSESDRANAARTLAQQRLIESRTAENRSQMLLYGADMKLASDAIVRNDTSRAYELLLRHTNDSNLRSFEWNFFRKQVSQPCNIELNLGSAIYDVQASPPGGHVAVACSDGKILIFETANWSEQQAINMNSKTANALAWSADGRTLAAACEDGSLHIWEADSAQRLNEISAHEGAANDVCFDVGGRQLYSCGDDGLVKRWNIISGQQLGRFAGHQREVESIALSPNGQLLASAGSDRRFSIWDSRSTNRLFHIPTGAGRAVSIAFAANGQRVAIGTTRGESILFDIKSGQHITLPRQPDGLEAICLLGGRWLATTNRGGVIQVRQLPSLSQHGSADFSRPLSWAGHAGRALTTAAISDGGLITGGADGMLRVWSPVLEATRWYTFRHIAPVSLASSPSGQFFTAGRKIFEWDLGSRRLTHSFGVSRTTWECLACSADGKYLAAVNGQRLVLFDLPARRAKQEWNLSGEHRISSHRLAISTDGRWIALADSHASEHYLAVYDQNHPQSVKRFPMKQCACLKFSPDGQWLAAGAMNDLKVFDFQSNHQPMILTGHSSTLSDVDFSPDGRLLATVGHDRLLKLWQFPEVSEAFSIVAHRDQAKSVSFTPNGKTLVTAGNSGVVKLWHVATGQPLGQLEPEASTVSDLQFGSNGLSLIGALENRSVVVYDATPNLPSTYHELSVEGGKFFRLGDLPGGALHSYPESVSSDGRFVSGWSESENGPAAFLWSAFEGMTLCEPSLGHSNAVDVSDDGRLFCGVLSRESGRRSLRWKDSRRIEELAPSPSYPVDMTASGSHVVGRQWITDHWESYVWTRGKQRFQLQGDSADDQFGFSVSSAGDVNHDGIDDIIVGARYGDVNGTDSGCAQVFSGADGELIFTFHGDSAGDWFGYCVRGAGDVNGDEFADLIVGAPHDDNKGGNSGSATVFSGRDGSVLFAWNGQAAGDLFGLSVSGAGDVNHDGFDDLIVGAPREATQVGKSGRVRVLSGKNGEGLFQFDGDALGDEFGYSVSRAGDVNQDDFDDLIVGAPRNDERGGNSGSSRVLSGRDGTTLFNFHGGSANDRHGTSVSGAGDVNGDGFDDLIIGVPHDSAHGRHAGIAVVYSGNDGSVLYKFHGDSANARLGTSVSSAGDTNNDGFDDLVVGAPRDGKNGDRSGSARVFSGRTGFALFTMYGESALDRLGWSVSGLAGTDNDGCDDVIVGSPRDARIGVADVSLPPPPIRLPSSPAHQHSQATSLSADGSVVLGVVFDAEGVTQNQVIEEFHLKVAQARPVIWRDRELEFPPGFDGEKNWWATDISDDGSVIVGFAWPNDHQLAAKDRNATTAFRWEAGRVQMLGSLSDCQQSRATAVSGDGRLVVGRCTRQWSQKSKDIGCIWSNDRGIQAVDEVLSAAGAIPAGFEIRVVSAISKDGSAIVGLGNNPEASPEGWWARLPRGFAGAANIVNGVVHEE